MDTMKLMTTKFSDHEAPPPVREEKGRVVVEGDLEIGPWVLPPVREEEGFHSTVNNTSFLNFGHAPCGPQFNAYVQADESEQCVEPIWLRTSGVWAAIALSAKSARTYWIAALVAQLQGNSSNTH